MISFRLHLFLNYDEFVLMSENKPLISIITPAHQVEPYIEETIKSVINQTYANWEMLLVVDKNSKDQTQKICELYAAKDHRLKVFKDLPQGGVTFNRNYAVKASRGQYICFLDSDDLWKPEKLEKHLQFMQSLGALMSCTAYDRVDHKGRSLNQNIYPRKYITTNDLYKFNDIGCLTVMIDSSLKDWLQFEPVMHEDFLLWLNLTKKTGQGFHAYQEILASYRVLPESRSSDKKLAALWRWKILYKELPVFKALGFFIIYTLKSLSNRL